MPIEVDPVRYAAAASHFSAFFDELCLSFVEREDLLAQIALALLCKEHVLVTGPPGTAKSQLASAVFRRILDEETGLPSLSTRQFVERTVQTDLIGPIDFKTLVETGRTERFTDEAMLGTVHAFLDEVFDGRDSALRATLDALHAREITQETKIPHGSIACALMTSNRYISPGLEASRRTLLAFMDRIAFVAFVPRGFADPANLGIVLRRQLGRAPRPSLETALTLQDIDTLQAVVDLVEVPPAVCDGIATFLDMIDAELNRTARADPTFVPTRHLSTRTAVRSGRILRAIVVYDRIFRNRERPLTVAPADLAWLRLHLILSGPSPRAVTKLLEREADPEERRQLEVLRTERELFERCWDKLPPIKGSPPSHPAGPLRARDSGAPARHSPSGPPPFGEDRHSQSPSDLDSQEAALVHTLHAGEPAAIVAALRAITPRMQATGADVDRAEGLVKEAVSALTRQAVRAGLTAQGKVRKLHETVTELSDFADAVDGAIPATRTLARWLRGRALDLIAEAAAFAPGASAADLEIAVNDALPGAPMTRVEARLSALEALGVQRKMLYAKGADASNREASEAAWKCAVGLAEEDLVLLLDDAFRTAVTETLGSVPAARLAEVLTRLAPEFGRIDGVAQRLAALRGTASAIKSRVVGPRIAPLVGAGLLRIDAGDRAVLMSQIDALVAVLREAGLSAVIAPREWLTWSANALVRADPIVPNQRDGEPDFDGYHRMRAAEQRLSNGYMLAEIALRIAPELTRGAARPEDSVAALAALLAQIPEPTRAQVVRFDLDRIARTVDYLERWWKWLSELGVDGVELSPRKIDSMRLAAMVNSKFFRVLLDDLAPMRFALEARIVAEIFPDCTAAAAALRTRLESLQLRARQRVTELLHRRANEAWEAALMDPAPRDAQSTPATAAAPPR